MPRRIFFKGSGVYNDSLLVGNHGNTELFIRGTFVIHGMIYCPKYTLIINVSGAGILKLHGICKKIEIRKIKGDCKLELEELSAGCISYYELNGSVIAQECKIPVTVDR
jgi:hypothetical protein